MGYGSIAVSILFEFMGVRKPNSCYFFVGCGISFSTGIAEFEWPEIM